MGHRDWHANTHTQTERHRLTAFYRLYTTSSLPVELNMAEAALTVSLFHSLDSHFVTFATLDAIYFSFRLLIWLAMCWYCSFNTRKVCWPLKKAAAALSFFLRDPRGTLLNLKYWKYPVRQELRVAEVVSGFCVASCLRFGNLWSMLVKWWIKWSAAFSRVTLWPCNLVKCRLCCDNICLSVCLSHSCIGARIVLLRGALIGMVSFWGWHIKGIGYGEWLNASPEYFWVLLSEIGTFWSIFMHNAYNNMMLRSP